MTVRYTSTRPDDELLRERMVAIARERRRFGYRRLHVLLKREGHHKRASLVLAALQAGAPIVHIGRALSFVDYKLLTICSLHL